MKFRELPKSPLKPQWVCENITPDLAPHRHDAGLICERCQPETQVRMEDVRVLHEATYKELAYFIDPNFLKQKIRAAELKAVKFQEIDGDTMVFRVPSRDFDENGITYTCLVKFDDWESTGSDVSLPATERARLLLWAGNIRLHCTDPSFIYWGYQYILSVIDAAVYPEERQPNIRNPTRRGICCKHLMNVLKVLPFYSGDIAKALKQQFG